MARLRLALAQLDCIVGDLDANVDRMVAVLGEAAIADADVVAFPELAITGYPPEDLLLKPTFVDDNLRALDRFAAATGETTAVVGFVDRTADGLANAAALCRHGEVVGRYHKRRLPNYAVFDEQRYFTPRHDPSPIFEVAGLPIGVSICEDAWAPGGPLAEQARAGACVVLNINASPYHRGKVALREAMLAERAAEIACPVAYVNLVGGQDELVFDGSSLMVDASGTVVARAPQFREHLLVVDVTVAPDGPASHTSVEAASVDAGSVTDPSLAGPRVAGSSVPATSMAGSSVAALPISGSLAALLPPAQEVYEALVLGTRDYVTKNGFDHVVIGLSGGVDSALVAAVATDALGADRVHTVAMPSRYSSEHSLADAEALAANLGVDHRTISIEGTHRAFSEALEPSLGGPPGGLTEENLQPRVRGTLLMALSNEFGWLVLTTGNKSEMAVGYATLYGDMAGGFAVIKDVPKLVVYEVCWERNARAGHPLIPESILTKAPSAELRPEQYDSDNLPPYEVLDAILEAYIEGDRTASDIVASGAFDPEVVRRVVRLVDLSEYKRRQAPPGVRITTKAFGKDRRLPITNRYRG